MKNKFILFVILVNIFVIFSFVMTCKDMIFNGATEPNLDYVLLFTPIFAFIIIFVIIFSKLFPYRLEIQDNTARITKRSIIPPFKNETRIIPNIKQAVINELIIFHMVLLEDSDGKKHNIYPFGSLKQSCVSLQKKINQTIANKSVLNIQISERGEIIDLSSKIIYTALSLLWYIILLTFLYVLKYCYIR